MLEAQWKERIDGLPSGCCCLSRGNSPLFPHLQFRLASGSHPIPWVSGTNLHMQAHPGGRLLGRFTSLPGISAFPFSLQFSCVRLTVTPWTAAHQASLSITNSWSLLKTHVQQVGDAIQPFHPLSSPSHPAFNLSQHQGLSH